MFIEHLAYFGVTRAMVENAHHLMTSAADTLTNYYMIPATLPLLDPLRLLPFVGNPLADRLDVSVLVNLGYGDIADGWSQGDADVQTPLGFLPPLSVLEQVPGALVAGVPQGISDAVADLENPNNYAFPTWLNMLLASLPASEGNSGATPTEGPTFDSFPLHTGVPQIDIAEALLFTLPVYDLGIFENELADGNLLDAIGVPIAADVGVLPLVALGLAA